MPLHGLLMLPIAIASVCSLLSACQMLGDQRPKTADSSLDFAAAGAQTLDLNDVTVLFPFPETGNLGGYVRVNGAGNAPLLPLELFAKIANLRGDSPFANQQLDYDNSFVVAFRYDPCAPRPDVPQENCKAQVRLVVQTLQTDGPIDAKNYVEQRGLHLVYALEHSTDAKVLSTLRELSSPATKGLPLGPHPKIVAEGIYGHFGQKILALITQVCDATRLEKVTFIGESEGAPAWNFGELRPEVAGHLDAENWTSRSLVSLPPDITLVTFSEGGQGGIRIGEIDPKPVTGDSAAPMLKDSNIVALNETTKAAYESLLRIENPKVHTIDSVDCVSCHVATGARLSAEAKLPLANFASSFRFGADSSMNLSLPADIAEARRTNSYVVISLGYLRNHPTISQRTINETAGVVHYLNNSHN